MTETATIYYHKPRIRKTNLRREMLEMLNDDIARLEDETPAKTNEQRKTFFEAPEITECTVPKDSVFNCCANTLRSLGLTGKYDGFVYICRAVEEILKFEESPHFQSIYYDIGKEYDVNRCSVERSIRYSVSYIKRAGNKHNLAAIFGDAMEDEKNFSNSKFLTVIAADVYEKLTVLEFDMN